MPSSWWESICCHLCKMPQKAIATKNKRFHRCENPTCRAVNSDKDGTWRYTSVVEWTR